MGRNYSVFYAALPWEAALRVIPRPSVHLFVPCPPLVENAKSYNVQTRYNARQEWLAEQFWRQKVKGQGHRGRYVKSLWKFT